MMMQSGILVSISGSDGGSLSIRDRVNKHFHDDEVVVLLIRDGSSRQPFHERRGDCCG